MNTFRNDLASSPVQPAIFEISMLILIGSSFSSILSLAASNGNHASLSLPGKIYPGQSFNHLFILPILCNTESDVCINQGYIFLVFKPLLLCSNHNFICHFLGGQDKERLLLNEADKELLKA